MLVRVFITSFLILAVYSCKSAAVVRDYEFTPNKKCDCFVKTPFIQIGTNSAYTSRAKAICNSSNQKNISDSLNFLSDENDTLRDKYSENDLLTKTLIAKNDSILSFYKNKWTSCKVKIKFKEQMTGETTSLITVNRKIVYYTNFGLKKLGKEKYINDSLVYSSMIINFF
jgi:hypothetical protein